MNQYLSYPYFDLWKAEAWKRHGSPIAPLIEKLSAKAEKLPAYPSPDPDPKNAPGYQLKPNIVEVPSVMEKWSSKGIRCTTKTLGGDRWMQLVPEKTLSGCGEKVPVLVFCVRGDKPDPYWSMRVLDAYAEDIDRQSAGAADGDPYIILFLAVEPDKNYTPEILMMLTECFALYPADIDQLFLDISVLAKEDVSGWRCTEFAGRSVIDISRKWEAANAHYVNLYGAGLEKEPDVDGEWLIHSMSGKALMDGIRLEYKYRHPDEPGLIETLHTMGLQYEAHDWKGSRYITVTPLNATHNAADSPADSSGNTTMQNLPDELNAVPGCRSGSVPGSESVSAQSGVHKIPCLLTMMEVAYTTEHGVVTALSNYMEYLKIAAEGEFMMVFFVLETVEDNELLAEIAEECCRKYPIDRTRIYLTGHSHNSAFALEFYRRHPDMIAACAAMNFPAILPIPKGGETAPNTDEWIEKMSHYDLPLINIGGYNEVHGGPGIYPVVDEEGWWKGWNRRLRSERCPERSREEILAAAGSSNAVERALRVPADRAEVFYLMGFEHYIADYRNIEGKYHFRLVSVQNMPHMITPTLAVMCWNFIRRFARNRETGETIELY